MRNDTLEFEGAKSVPVKGKGKRKQTTRTFAISATGQILPMQLIYAGKAKRCHPQGIEFPSGFDVTHSLNHWSNKGSLKDQFQTWYTYEVQKQMGNGKGVYEVDVDTRLSRISPYMHVGQLAFMISYGIVKKRLRIDLKLPQLRRH